jgi:hypothetical protein
MIDRLVHHAEVINLGAPALGLLEAAAGGSGVPAVEGSGALDELTHGDDGGGEVEVEVDDWAVAVGAAAELADVVDP